MPSTIQQNQRKGNFLLAALEPAEQARVKTKLEQIEFPLGEVLYEAGDKMEYAYFPITCVVSMLYLMENGGTAEIGLIGNDGIIGAALYLGGETTSSRAVIQSAGDAYRLKKADLKEEFARGGRFQYILLRYTQALMTQISQTAVCNRLHTVEKQLCRWLLLTHDRLQGDKIIMTHDLISNMLGVRREGITIAAKKLAQKKLIKNTRGTIAIIDRLGMEKAACECYEIVNNEYNRLLGRGISRTFG